MSARQLRRLQNLVRASTGADEDAETECPSNMRMPKGAKRSGRHQKLTSQKVQDENDAHKQQHPQTEEKALTASPVEKQDRQERTGNGSERVALAVEGRPGAAKRANRAVEVEVGAVVVGVQEKEELTDERRKKKQRNKNARAKRRKEEREDELLLEEALRQREEDAFAEGGRFGTGSGRSDEVDLLELLSVCDVKKLDTREERIRRFGARAVEDIGDGRVPQRRAESRPTSLLFAEHAQFVPRFFHSLLATPNRYCWPQYDGLGVTLVAKGTKSAKNNEAKVNDGNTNDGGPLLYYLDDSSAETRRAEAALAVCGSMHAGVEGIMTCLAAAPYHIPTLIIASNLFETMGNIPRAQEAIDIALYHVGVLLSRFPVRQTVRRRCLPFGVTPNRQLFQVLRCGVHQALRKAATRTAWEIAKLIYSLDDTDPLGMLLQLDYLALRAKQWAWLVQVSFIVARELERHAEGKVDDTNDAWSNRKLALALSTLPGFFFSTALAKYFLEREEATSAVSGVSNKGKSSKVLRELTPTQLHAFRNTPPASVMLAHAISRFPSAAVLIVEKIGGQSVVSSVPVSWQDIVKAHELNTEENSLHVASMWVARNAEIWKAADPCAFLRRVITEDDGLWLKSHRTDIDANLSASAAVVTAESPHLPTPWKHASLTEEDILCQTLTTIPAHLLDPNEITEEDLRDEVRRATRRELTPLEQLTLLRFESLYGPLSPPAISPSERLSRYNTMFEEEGRVRQIGEDHNPLSLFFRMFLPWNSTREMALRAALDTAGIPDPVASLNHQLRMEEELSWQIEMEEEEEEEEGEDWETEDSWYADDYMEDTDDEDA
ncbi:putative Transcriptional repressor TCF25 [Trypanosoma cruzi]|nr:putative Transcriptional repressor TCF25 [Trypanosoma cruzi]